MSKFIILLVALTIGLGLVPIKTQADGMIVPPYDYMIRESGQKAVIFYEKGKEILILTISFKGDAKDFGWVIPVPQKPEVTKGSDEIFTSLNTITQKYRTDYYKNPIPLMTGVIEENGAEPVTVIETKKIDYYDVAVLAATESQALAKWLSDNGYQYPEESSYILNDYINNKWYFVAVKISPEAAGAEDVIKGLEEGHVTPLKLEFNSDAIIYPLRISAIQSGTKTINLSDNLILNQERIILLKSVGYEDLIDKERGPEIFNQIVQDLLDGKYYLESVVADYPTIIGEWNYDNAGCYAQKNCESVVEGWFNNYFSREGLYYYDNYSINYAPIYLYVITDRKKETPGFSIDYANNIGAKEIRKLAYDINGKPLIEPQGNKYYLTYLFRNMPIKEINSDLVLRDAADNQRVNAPNPWLNFLLGGLVALVSIIVWIFSPLGLIFIISTLVRGLVKVDILKIFGRIFQILTLLITFVIFLFLLVVSLKSDISLVRYFWVVGLICGLGLVSLGQIIISKKI